PDWSWTEYGRGLVVAVVRLWTDCRCGQFADMDNSWLRLPSWTDCGRDADADWLRSRTRPGQGRGLDSAAVTARIRTVFGLDAVTDWTRTRSADRILARTICDQTATVARTQKPHFDEE
ncbi:MAG: hypothetical protein ACLQSR_14175, partial [Limisphaerales bacterium]